jgi:phospholipid-binding lipoprotein MlaA
MKFAHRFLAAASALALSACAEVPTDPAALAEYESANDPAEPTNRAIFSANYFLDRNLLQPIARAYTDYIPEEARHPVHNFLANMGEPVVLVNDLLQGNTDKAWTTTRRFAVNSTVGGAGLFDPATGWGLDYHAADFGQTFGVWGIGTGPTLQLPLFGFSNVRDTVGLALNSVANPANLIPGTAAQIAIGGVAMIDGRASVLPITDDLERSSLDYYASLRSVVAAKRAELVEQGRSDEPPSPQRQER